MRIRKRVAFVVPAGRSDDDVVDTLTSVLHYSDPARLVVVIDDMSRSGTSFPDLHDLSSDIVVLQPPAGLPANVFGGLWAKTAFAYHWLLERYEPGLVIRLDTDALLIGAGLEACAERAFARDSRLGLLGAYRIGPDGGERDFSWAARQVRATAGVRGLLRPRRRLAVRRYRELARAHGYADGEHVLAAACILSAEAIGAIDRNGWFTRPGLSSALLGDDHIMSMLTVAAGYGIADFSGPDDPMALKWVGLPAHPADLLARGKLVTHSVRSWDELGQTDIRRIFAAARLPPRADDQLGDPNS
jgi:hypothetical protein